MESAQEPLRLKINHIVYTTVEGIRASDIGGWWVQFAGSRESLHFQGDKPYEVNDQVKITFEKVTHADDDGRAK